MASESGLRLIYKKAFHEILQEEKDSRDFGPLLGKMGVLNEYGESAMDADQWEAASKCLPKKKKSATLQLVENEWLIWELITDLYMGFAFEKM